MNFTDDPRPIGVFDSGVGGLTVLKSLMTALPGEQFIYLGDTARVPYGTKSADTVRAYALGLAQGLIQNDVKMIVIACNTASVHAADAVAALVAPVPVVSMIGPAVQAAIKATRNNSILVMATQSTIRSGAYERALLAANPALSITSIPAQVLIALAEEGWTDGAETDAIINRYIGPSFSRENAPDTIILGCTHFPLMKAAIAAIAGPDVTLIDSGHAATRSILNTCAPNTCGNPLRTTAPSARLRFLVTDAPERFQPMAERFLGQAVHLDDITHIDLTSFDKPQPARHSAAAPSS